jgi:hypothetical protein
MSVNEALSRTRYVGPLDVVKLAGLWLYAGFLILCAAVVAALQDGEYAAVLLAKADRVGR